MSPARAAWGVGGAGVLATALLASAFPLATYTLSLAMFGLPHVLAEFGWVRHRYAARLAPAVRAGVVALLAGVLFGRVGRAAGFGTAAGWSPAELALVAGMALAALGVRGAGAPRRVTVGAIGTAVVVGVGLVRAPATTLLGAAMLHNWTPVGLLAEGLDGAARRRAMAACAVVFGVVPVLIASGALPHVVARAGWTAPDVGPLTTGGLAAQLGAYLPAAWRDAPWARDVFAALAYTQCMHYAAVLHVLPRIAGAQGAPAWGGLGHAGRAAVAVVCVALSVGFVVDFAVARAWYGVAAALHAWVEVPALLVALGGRPPAERVVAA
jgi:hypothetical protein